MVHRGGIALKLWTQLNYSFKANFTAFNELEIHRILTRLMVVNIKPSAVMLMLLMTLSSAVEPNHR